MALMTRSVEDAEQLPVHQCFEKRGLVVVRLPSVTCAITFNDGGDDLPPTRSLRELGFVDPMACPTSVHKQPASFDQDVSLVVYVG
jgi:hypothetical protein